MTKLALLIAVLAAGCLAPETEQHFVIDYEPRTLGAGLEYTFRPMRIVCEPHQDFPYACDQHVGTLEHVSATGAGELLAREATAFELLGREPGIAHVDVRANVTDDAGTEHLARTFEISVVPIAYSQLGWYASDTITPPDGAAFRSSTVDVWQHHYRKPRTELVDALTSEIVAAELDGDAPFTLDAGTTTATLTSDGRAHVSARIATGDTLGTATVHTTAGGAFTLDIVDESSIGRLDLSLQSLDRIVVYAYDAADRPILGCPRDRAPTLIDPTGALRVDSVRETPWRAHCELQLESTGARIETPIVVRWGGHEATVTIKR